jgi:hypothetical protein
MDDKKAYEHYDNPNNLKPAGSARRLSRRALSSHVPVRFPPETIARVKELAERDGVTLSAWIRHVVDVELRRRSEPNTGFEIWFASGNIVTPNSSSTTEPVAAR